MQMHPLAEPELPRAAALSALAGWNQTLLDWAFFRRHGQARAMDDRAAPELAATAATLAYGPGLAWISMVLVRPDRRRQGLATQLLRWALASLQAQGIASIVLDATPAGQEVYRQLGFRDLWGFARWALPATLPAEPGPGLRPLQAGDWPAVLQLDRAAFGADRETLLRSFAARLPAAAFVAEGPEGICGAVLARDGVRAPQLGPVWARDPAIARALIAAALAAAPCAFLDLRDQAAGLGDWLTRHGARPQRPFTRMVLGADPPGDSSGLAALAGPEFG